MTSSFTVGGKYSRDDVAAAAGLPDTHRKGGQWSTGYSEWNGEVFIFANVGSAGRTGHDYANRWDDGRLVWFGKTNAVIGQPQLDRILSGNLPVHVFWREKDREPFTYAGLARCDAIFNEKPVRVVWQFA